MAEEDEGLNALKTAETAQEVLDNCTVITLKAWYDQVRKNSAKRGVLYERFAEVYHRFWEQGVSKAKNDVKGMRNSHILELDIPNVDDPEYDLQDLPDPVPQPMPQTAEDLAAEDAEQRKALSNLQKNTDRNKARKKAQIQREFDVGDLGIPNASEIVSLMNDRLKLKRLVMKRHNGTLKINDYEGTMQYYVLQNANADMSFKNRDSEVPIQKNEPLALALLYHMTPCAEAPADTRKAKEFYYLAHLASSEALKSNGVGYMLFTHLRDNVVGDLPLFLELDETNKWKNLRRTYEVWGFHTAYEMRREKVHQEWMQWYAFMKKASVHGWTATFDKGDQLINIFGTDTCAATNHLWMVYWKSWFKPPLTIAQYKNPDTPMDEVADAPVDHMGALLTSEAAGTAGALVSESMEVDEDPSLGSELLPDQFIAMPSEGWAKLYDSTHMHRNMHEELMSTLSGPDVEHARTRSTPFTYDAFVRPFRAQKGRGASPLYTFEFRNYVFAAPRDGYMDAEPGSIVSSGGAEQPGNVVSLKAGEPCGYAECILLHPEQTQCPPLWVVKALGIQSQDTSQASVQPLLRALLNRLKEAASSHRMLLLLHTSSPFRKDYGWLLRAEHFVEGADTAHQMLVMAGPAFVNFFDAHSDGNALEYALNPEAQPRDRRYTRIYERSDCPSRSENWVCFWGGVPVPQTIRDWPTELRRLVPAGHKRMQRHALLRARGSFSAPLMATDGESTYELTSAIDWLKDEGSTLTSKMAQFGRLYTRFEIVQWNARSTRIRTQIFCWDGPHRAPSCNAAYKVTFNMFILHMGQRVCGFARVFYMEPFLSNAADYVKRLPFLVVKEAFAESEAEFKELFDRLQSTFGDCVMLAQLGSAASNANRWVLSDRKEIKRQYQAARFQPGGSVLQAPRTPTATLYKSFFQYLVASLDSAIHTGHPSRTGDWLLVPSSVEASDNGWFIRLPQHPDPITSDPDEFQSAMTAYQRTKEIMEIKVQTMQIQMQTVSGTPVNTRSAQLQMASMEKLTMLANPNVDAFTKTEMSEKKRKNVVRLKQEATHELEHLYQTQTLSTNALASSNGMVVMASDGEEDQEEEASVLPSNFHAKYGEWMHEQQRRPWEVHHDPNDDGEGEGEAAGEEEGAAHSSGPSQFTKTELANERKLVDALLAFRTRLAQCNQCEGMAKNP